MIGGEDVGGGDGGVGAVFALDDHRGLMHYDCVPLPCGYLQAINAARRRQQLPRHLSAIVIVENLSHAAAYHHHSLSCIPMPMYG